MKQGIYTLTPPLRLELPALVHPGPSTEDETNVVDIVRCAAAHGYNGCTPVPREGKTSIWYVVVKGPDAGDVSEHHDELDESLDDFIARAQSRGVVVNLMQKAPTEAPAPGNP